MDSNHVATFLDAARDGQLSNMNVFLQQNPDLISAVDDRKYSDYPFIRKGATALIYAAYAGKVECLSELISRKADLNAKDTDYGFTALIQAAENGKVDCMQALLEAGADKEAKSQLGWTALMSAAEEGEVECLNTLLGAGCAKDVQNSNGHTALMIAAENGKVDCIQALLEAGADKEAKSQAGWTALMCAARAGQVECLKTLLGAGCAIDVQNSNSNTALMIAARWGKNECVGTLLVAGANKDITDTSGETALMKAAANGSDNCLKALVQAGAVLDAKNNDGRSALMLAAYWGQDECTKSLLEAGADKDVRDDSGQTALMKAVKEGHRSCILLLLEAGGHLNIRIKEDETMLMQLVYDMQKDLANRSSENELVKDVMFAVMVDMVHLSQTGDLDHKREIEFSKAIKTAYLDIAERKLWTKAPLLDFVKMVFLIDNRIHQTPGLKEDLLSIRVDVLTIIQAALGISEMDDTSNIISALSDQNLYNCLDTAKMRNTVLGYCLLHNLTDIICAPPCEQLVDICWGTQRLGYALQNKDLKWSTEFTQDDRWSFDIYRRIPCLRMTVVFLLHVLYLVFTYFVLLIKDQGTSRFVALFFMLMIMTGGFLTEEARQFQRTYFSNPWNLFDTLILFLYIVWGIRTMVLSDEDSLLNNNILLSICACVLLFRILGYAQIYQSSAVLVSVVLEMMSDLINFALLYIANIVGFTVIFATAFPNLEVFHTLDGTALILFSVSLGNFDFDIFDGQPKETFGNAILMLYLVLSSVVLLNLLIALLSVTFTNSTEKQYPTYRLLFSNLVMEYYHNDDWLPQPLCLLNIFCWSSSLGGKETAWFSIFKKYIIFPLDVVVMLCIVGPVLYCWQFRSLLKYCIILKQKTPHWFSIFIFFFLLSSPLWFPFYILVCCWRDEKAFAPQKCLAEDTPNPLVSESLGSSEEKDSDGAAHFPGNNNAEWLDAMKKEMAKQIDRIKQQKNSDLYYVSTTLKETSSTIHKIFQQIGQDSKADFNQDGSNQQAASGKVAKKKSFMEGNAAHFQVNNSALDDRLKNLEEKIELILNRLDSHK